MQRPVRIDLMMVRLEISFNMVDALLLGDVTMIFGGEKVLHCLYHGLAW